MVTRLYLASTSPARLATMRAAGIEPWLITPDVDEDEAAAVEEQRLGRYLTTAELVQLLARAKAEAALTKLQQNNAEIRGLIFGGDSAFEFEGASLGKPHTPDVAFERIRNHRGKTGTLFSGHWLIDARDAGRGADLDPSRIRATGAVNQAEVTMVEDFDDAEIEAYIATGEPLKVAGGFTIDSLGSAFIESVVGDPSTVVGLSVPTLRRMARELGVAWPEFWNRKGGVALSELGQHSDA